MSFCSLKAGTTTEIFTPQRIRFWGKGESRKGEGPEARRQKPEGKTTFSNLDWAGLGLENSDTRKSRQKTESRYDGPKTFSISTVPHPFKRVRNLINL